MYWENTASQCPDLPDSEIPPELLDGLERLSHGAVLLKVRFRWRPHESTATGFLTKDRLLDIRDQPVEEVARTLASHATHLHDGGTCEGKFEAQVQREFEELVDERPKREWRSITFYVSAAADLRPNTNMGMDDHHDFAGRDRAPSREAKRSTLPSTPTGYDDYAEFVELSRTDPTAFAMLVIQQSNDRVVTTLERLLDSSVNRLDGVLAQQGSSSRYLNEAFQTLTKGAGSIAGLGVQLFNEGLENQARVARLEHETELGKERTELMRDAVKQGSLLAQAVLMANSAKRKQRGAEPAAESAARPRSSRRRRRKGRRRNSEASAETRASVKRTPRPTAPAEPPEVTTTPSEPIEAPRPVAPADPPEVAPTPGLPVEAPSSSDTSAPSSDEAPDPRLTLVDPAQRPSHDEDELDDDEFDDDDELDDDDDDTSEADRDIETRAERLLELLDDELLDKLRETTPTLYAMFEELDGGPLDADVIRDVIERAQTGVDRSEFAQVQELFEPELASAFAGLLMRVMSEDM